MSSNSPEIYNTMAAEYLTEEEKEVAKILCMLPSLLVEFRNSPPCNDVVGDLKWGRRRPRSVYDERVSLARKEDHEEEEKKTRLASPVTPLAFPVSGGEEEGIKKPKRHRQWVKEQTGMISILSQQNSDLRQQIEEHKARLESSRGINKSLKERRSKIDHAMEQPQLLTQRLATTNPGTFLDCQCAPMPSAFCRPAFELDLNKAPEEEDEVMAAPASRCWQQQNIVAYNTMAKEARKRRREIRRAKNSIQAVYITGMPATSYKIQRCGLLS